MEQSATSTSKPKVGKLAITSIALCLIPIVGILGVIFKINSFIIILCLGLTLITSLLGIVLGQKASGMLKQNKATRTGFNIARAGIAINLFFLCSLFVLFFIAKIYDSFAIRNLGWDSDVKGVAHIFQTALEDYKGTHNGERPASIRAVEYLIPVYVKNMKNPFNHRQTYTVSGGGLMDGEPTNIGQVGYIAPRTISDPYVIVIHPKRDNDSLRLVEKVVIPKADSGGAQRP
jgi:hypothetical protein